LEDFEMRTKKLLVLALAVIMITAASVPVFASGISVLIDGTPVNFDQQPVIENGRTLVPLRAMFEALGATVDWNQSTQTVTSVKDDITVSLTIGSNILTKNGAGITLDVPAKIVGGRTLVPARAVAESFGAEVGWVQSTQTVVITTTGQSATPPANPLIGGWVAIDPYGDGLNYEIDFLADGKYYEAIYEPNSSFGLLIKGTYTVSGNQITFTGTMYDIAEYEEKPYNAVSTFSVSGNSLTRDGLTYSRGQTSGLGDY